MANITLRSSKGAPLTNQEVDNNFSNLNSGKLEVSTWEASDAFGITSTNISNWNTAYGWGNHADAGYLTSFTETDPTVPSHVKSITTTNISNWNTAYGWGNHASQGYATQTYVNNAVSNLVDSAPTTLDTLNELAAALGDDPNFATTVSNSIGTKASKAGDTFTGKVKISLDGGTSPSSMFEIHSTANATGQRSGLQMNTQSGWSTTIYTEQGNWWHAFGNNSGDFAWGYDGTNLYEGSNRVFTDGYHPNADKWTTARTLSLTGDVTGSVSWDGSGNASITATVANDSHTHSTSTISDLSADTVNNNANNIAISGFYHATSNIPTSDGESDKAVLHNQYGADTNWATQIATSWRNGRMWVRNKENGTWEAWQGIFADNYHPNADKWTTARTITLSGDLTGSVSLDGSSNVTLSAQVVNNSHTHDDRYARAQYLGQANIDDYRADGLYEFDPIPTGTPPIQSPNLRVLMLGNDGRTTQMAFNYATDQAWFRRKHNTTWHDWREFIHSGNIGSQSVNYATSAGNADTVDGLHASSFIRSDANDTFTGNLTTGANNHITFGPNSTWGSSLRVGGNGRTATGTEMASVVTTDGNLHLDAADSTNAIYLGFYAGSRGTIFGSGSGGIVARMDTAGNLYKATSATNSTATYWHSGNDGSGSGLDADLIDGIDSSRIVYGGGASKINSHSNANSQVNSGFYENGGGGSNWPSSTWYNSINVRHSNQGNYHGFQLAMSYYDNHLWARSYQGSGTFQGWAKQWSTYNDGSGSGLDADLLDGAHGSYYWSKSTIDCDRNIGSSTNLDTDLANGGVFKSYGSANTSWNAPFSYGGVIGYKFASSSILAQIGFDIRHNTSDYGNFMFRTHNNLGWNNWVKVWHNYNDGSGSGLDADLLDGQHGSYYLPTNTAVASITTSAWAGGNGYYGYTYSGGNHRFGFSSTSGVIDVYADGNFYATDSSHLVLHAGNYNSYAPSLSGAGASGTWGINVSGNSNGLTIVGNGSNNQTYGQTSGTLNGYTGWASHIIGNHGNGATYYMQDIILPFWGAPKYSRRQGNTTIVGPYDFWTSENDGSGSGLDADLLDGSQGTYYDHRRYTDSNNYLGGHYTSGGYELPNSSALGAGKLKLIMLRGGNLGISSAWNDCLWMSAYTGGDVKKSTLLVSTKYDNTNMYILKQNFDSSTFGSAYLFWNSGNDGSGSGLDADLLDGLHAGSFWRRDSDNTGYAVRFGQAELDFATGSHTAIPPMSMRLWDNYVQSGAPSSYGTVLDIYGRSGHAHNQLYFEGNTNNLRMRRGWYGNNNWSGWANFWNSENDGSGSGLDADLLDGVQGGSYLRSDATDYVNGNLMLRADLVGDDDGYRDHGVYGNYDSYRIDHIWSMGTSYRINANGSNFGNLYGLAYTYHNRVYTSNTMGGYHQMVWCSDGTPKCALGSNIWTAGNVTAYSDRRVKTNIVTIDNAVEKVKQLGGYTFERTDAKNEDGSPVKQTGVIAQEVLAVLPEAVTGDEESHYNVAYGNMVGLLIEAIKEQQSEIDELKSLVKTLLEK